MIKLIHSKMLKIVSHLPISLVEEVSEQFHVGTFLGVSRNMDINIRFLVNRMSSSSLPASPCAPRAHCSILSTSAFQCSPCSPSCSTEKRFSRGGRPRRGRPRLVKSHRKQSCARSASEIWILEYKNDSCHALEILGGGRAPLDLASNGA